MIKVTLYGGQVLEFDPNTISKDPWAPTVLTPKLGAAFAFDRILLVGIGDFIGEGSWSNNPYTVVTTVQSVVDGVTKDIWKWDPVIHKCFISTTMTDSNKGFIIRGGDWYPVDVLNNLFLPEPDFNQRHQRILDVLRLVVQFVDHTYILNNPKLMHLIKLHGDGQFPQVTAGKNHDAGWLQRNWKYRTGEYNLTAWGEDFQRGSEGFNNCHYDALLWTAFAYMLDQTPANWNFGYSNALIHACIGRMHTKGSKWQGRARYEKGFTTPGDWNAPSWGKQWSLGLAIWAYITLDPLLIAVLNESMDKLKLVTPQQAWNGAWGERIGANWLHEVNLAYTIRPGEVLYKQHIDNAVTYFLSLRNTKDWWTNIGDSNAPASPWMASKMIHALWNSLDLLGEAPDSQRRLEVIKSAEAILRDGFYEYKGHLRCRYRFPPHPEATAANETPALVAISLPMLRVLAEHSPAKYTDLYAQTSTWLANTVGIGWSEVANDLPAPDINLIGIEFPRQGLGWTKACKMYLQGCKV